MSSAEKMAPWVGEFFSSWARYGAQQSSMPVFYGLLAEFNVVQLRVPREKLAVAHSDDQLERQLLDLWQAWHAFMADDWSHAMEKIAAIGDKLTTRPEPYIFFAVAQLVQNNRRGGFQGIHRALKSDPKNAALHTLLSLLGIRRPPVVQFLPRGNPINVVLGKVRHHALGALN